MISKDDITLLLYQNIHADEIKDAIENGTLLSYYSTIATRLMEMNGSSGVGPVKTSIRREEPKKLFIDTPLETKSNVEQIRPISPQPRLVKDSVRVRGNL